MKVGDILKAYYGSRFSPHMTRTPEGFLVCDDVHIARTGYQEYLAQELGLSDLYDQKVQVYRPEEEVFSPAALASFEGKPVTDEHPNGWVKPDNAASYLKGVTQNVRRGTGEDSDKVIADLIIYDPILLSEIENGKREISCGYDCVYEEMQVGEKYMQTAIRGNHVAVVTAGRAGETVAIKDQKLERSKKSMKKSKFAVLTKMYAKFVQDADPDEVETATEIMTEKSEDQESPAVNPEGEILQKIMDRLDSLEAKLAAPPADEDPLEKLEQDLEGEESATIPVEGLDEDPIVEDEDEGPVAGAETLPENPLPNADRQAAKLILRQMKPVIAAMTDKKQKQAAVDALTKAVNQLVGQAKKNQDGYKQILAAKQKRSAQDAKVIDQGQIGKDIAAKHNKHYAKKHSIKEVN